MEYKNRGSRAAALAAMDFSTKARYYMPYQFFLISVRDAGSAASELNAFLRNHRVLAVDRRWVDQSADSYWSFCVDYLEASSGAALSGRVPKGRGKDYREILSPADFAVFAKLRELRKQIAQSDAVNRRSRVRFVCQLTILDHSYGNGSISEDKLQRRGTSLVAFTRAAGASSLNCRSQVLQQLSVSGHKARTG